MIMTASAVSVATVTTGIRNLSLPKCVVGNINRALDVSCIMRPIELDSHADTCCAGSNCSIIEYTGKICNVIGFNRDNPNDKLTDTPVVKTATAYDAPTGESYIIVLSQGLYLGDYISYSFLSPNQLRHNELVVDDGPRHLSHDPANAMHFIFLPNENERIPLEMCGVIMFHTRKPTAEDIETLPWLTFTSELD
jgi:hypothetical protein